MSPTIVLINPLAPAMQAALESFRSGWPEARCVNLLDDSLPFDLKAQGLGSPAIRRRIETLLYYARDLKAAGILFTGSGFGPLLDEIGPTLGVPLLKPNQAMYEEALALVAPRDSSTQAGRLGMLVTFPAAADAMRQDFDAAAATLGANVALDIHCVPDAFEAMRTGNNEEHNRLLALGAAQLAHCNAILMAQFTSAQAAPAVAKATRLPVLTSPGAAVKKLRLMVERQANQSGPALTRQY